MERSIYQRGIKAAIISPIYSKLGKLPVINNLEQDNTKYNIDFIFLNRFSSQWNIYINLLAYLKNYIYLIKFYQKIDIIQIECFFSKVRVILDFFLIATFKKKLVYDFQGDFLSNLRDFGPFFKFVILLNVKMAGGIMCLNRSSYLFLKRHNKNTVQIFNYVRDIEILKNDNCKPYDVVYHGRITYKKGFRILIELALNNPQWKFLMIGLIASEIPRSFPSNMTYIPSIIEKRLLYEQLLKSKIYVFPSYREGMSFSLIEAMNIGLPVVASDICSNRHLLSHCNLQLVNTYDYRCYERNLNILLKNMELRDSIGRQNRLFIKRNLTKEKYFRYIYSLYSKIVSSNDQRKYMKL